MLTRWSSPNNTAVDNQGSRLSSRSRNPKYEETIWKFDLRSVINSAKHYPRFTNSAKHYPRFTNSTKYYLRFSNSTKYYLRFTNSTKCYLLFTISQLRIVSLGFVGFWLGAYKSINIGATFTMADFRVVRSLDPWLKGPGFETTFRPVIKCVWRELASSL